MDADQKTEAARPAAPRKTPTLDSLSPSQIAAIRSIPPHEQAHVPAIDSRRPVSMFVDPAHYERERSSLFRRIPVPVTLSSMLPEPKMFLAHEGYGVPLLLSRDAEGKVHAFLNACQHKGSKVVERCDAFKAGRVSCPYHAWTYASNGQLIGIPRQETFPTVDKADHGLTELPSLEAAGFIWVALDREAPADFSGVTDELIDDFAALGLPTAHIFDRATHHLDANWKLVIEPFLEGYHVQRLHSASIGDLFADVPNAVDRLGPHIRQISGKANFEPEMLDLPGENIHKTVTHAYLVFPNTIIVTSPYYINVMIIMPAGVGKSVVDYFMLTPGPADNPKAQELYTRSFELMQKVFGTEDFRAACISQVGLESGALKEVVYGGLEAQIPVFYETVDRYMNPGNAPRA
ncbi:MAG: aromatic ring-hydroxylating dioxygenase subunit alpha [Caulobacter sp.]|nr:aromatic ring-hydroxylating dioxygenase subunit alpha [Caulobacter sp.]